MIWVRTQMLRHDDLDILCYKNSKPFYDSIETFSQKYLRLIALHALSFRSFTVHLQLIWDTLNVFHSQNGIPFILIGIRIIRCTVHGAHLVDLNWRKELKVKLFCVKIGSKFNQHRNSFDKFSELNSEPFINRFLTQIQHSACS